MTTDDPDMCTACSEPVNYPDPTIRIDLCRPCSEEAVRYLKWCIGMTVPAEDDDTEPDNQLWSRELLCNDDPTGDDQCC